MLFVKISHNLKTTKLSVKGSSFFHDFLTMVKSIDAFVTNATMLRPLTGDGDIAQVTSSIFNHMQMLLPIKLWHWSFTFHSSNCGMCWINNCCCKVEQKEKRVENGGEHNDCQEKRSWQIWEHHGKRDYGQKKHNNPGKDLLWMEGQLEPVNAPPFPVLWLNLDQIILEGAGSTQT